MPAHQLPWFKVWIGATSHEKVRTLDDGTFRTWVELLDAAARQKERGCFSSRSSAVAILRRPAGHLDELIAVRLVDELPDGSLEVHGWGEWQTGLNPVRRAYARMRLKLRRIVFGRDGELCARCGATLRLEIDHIVPIARGGGNELDNLQVLCMPCNRRKQAH